MSRTMIQAAVTMHQLQQKLDMIGHNMANSQTPGYKARHSQFSSLLKQNINNLNSPANEMNRLTPVGVRVGTGAKLGAIMNDMSHGALKNTDRALDLALMNENHFFQIQTDVQGVLETRYTRDGNFYLNPVNEVQVMLTTGDGNPVLGQNGAPILIQNGFDRIEIRDNGEVLVERGNVQQVAGTIGVVEINRPHVLEATGGNLFRIPDLEELGYTIGEIVTPLGTQGRLMESGKLEASNVDLAEQMTELISTQRAYQFNARTISTSDQMLGLINQLRN